MKNRFVHYGLVLLVIAGVSAGILGLVNDFTKVVISQNGEKVVQEARREVLATATSFDEKEAKEADGMRFIPGYDANGEITGYVTTVTSAGYAGDIKFVMGITKEGKVSGISITSSQETPGLGAKIGGKDWQAHWAGKDASYEFNKAEDAFAGATISPTAVYTGIIKALKAYDTEVRK